MRVGGQIIAQCRCHVGDKVLRRVDEVFNRPVAMQRMRKEVGGVFWVTGNVACCCQLREEGVQQGKTRHAHDMWA
jgi:hypothetical protein